MNQLADLGIYFPQTFKKNLVQNVLVLLLKMHSESIEENNIVLIYNIYFVIFGDIAVGILLPLKYLIKQEEEDIIKPNNVSTKIPRRETTPEMK